MIDAEQTGYMKSNRKMFGGFSLLEILITVAIISIMTTASMVSLRGLRDGRAVDAGARTLAASVREAQNYALTGRNIAPTPTVPSLFSIRTDGTDRIYLEQTDRDGTVFVSSYRLGDDVTVSASLVQFLVPRAEPWAGGSELSGTDFVDFAVSRNGVSSHICVYPMGRVEEREGGCS